MVREGVSFARRAHFRLHLEKHPMRLAQRDLDRHKGALEC